MASQYPKFFHFKKQSGIGLGLRLDSGEFDFIKAAAGFSGLSLNSSNDAGMDGLFEKECLSFAYVKKMLDKINEGECVKAFPIDGNLGFLPPVLRPSKIIAIGKNYAEHAKEMGGSVPAEPMFFGKLASAVIPAGGAIQIPTWLDSRVDHEGELTVVISRRAKNMAVADALTCVAGYTIANDVTARTLQKQDRDKGYPWLRCKNLDTFLPLGPYFVPADCFNGVPNLSLKVHVDGVLKQSAQTSEMVFSIPVLVSYLSRWMTLEPGDLILTGTPEGVSPLKAGQTVEVEVENLGSLRNSVQSIG